MIKKYLYFIKSILKYSLLNKSSSFKITWKHLFPQLNDLDKAAGNIDPHYFFQDIWAAQKILKSTPTKHIDIGSRVDGFISHLLVFREVDLVDIRPLPINIPNLNFICDNATTLGTFKDNSVSSLSCLHAAEHFGLGRYSDPIDPDAYKTLIQSIQRVIKKKGKCYFSVPIGNERVCFNAHRIFNPQTIIDSFKQMSLISFSAINDQGQFIPDNSPSDYTNANYSCGLFEFEKN